MANRKVSNELKLLKGTHRPSRDKSKLAAPVPGIPERPKGTFWGPEHDAAWDAHLKAIPRDVMAVEYGLALECLVCSFVDLSRARAAADPPFYTTSTGLVKKHPAVAMVAEADKRYSAWMSKFGLSPSDRDKVSKVEPPKPESAWASLAKGEKR